MIPKVETPKANPENLLTLVQAAYEGKVVLPEFQRSFVWERENIEELLVSILQGYFIGTFLILDTPVESALFPFRPVEGLDKVNPYVLPGRHATVRLVLDGQQRLTSLFYVLYEPPMPLKNSQNPYRFFLRLDLLLDGSPEEAVCGVSLGDRGRLAAMQQMVEKGEAIGFSLFRDPGRFYGWLYQEHQGLASHDRDILHAFYQRVAGFMVPVVAISPEAGEDNIVNIFERINRTGVSLSLFDLAAARLYRKGIHLRELWNAFKQSDARLAELIRPEFMLKIISLWLDKEPRKGAILNVVGSLDKSRFEELWEQACEWVRRAYQRLSSPDGYGAFDPKWIPYTTILVPLAALMRQISEGHGGEEMYRKLDRWYWGSVFTQRYDQAVDSTTYRDVRSIGEWLAGGPCPPWLESFQPEQLNLFEIEGQRSSIYRGVMCLVVAAGAKDFISGQPSVLAECQDDHIFPWAKFQDQLQVDSIVNRTLISSTSNQIKSHKLPSEYLQLFLEKHGGDWRRLQATLDSHLISEEARQAMERNDFGAFLKARQAALQKEIARRVKGTA